MTDRMDIDALLIGALYGELTPADEARLTAYLESHPADRGALDDLTHTRAAVRESRIFAVQVDPPQSVSALLIQEAARRAPKPDREAAGWFHRFTRSFLVHPAMAAAAMLVVVVGVAGTLYVRRGDLFVESAPPAKASEQAVARDPAESRSAPDPAASPPPAPETGRADDRDNSAGAGLPANTGSAAGSDGYRVGLDEVAARPGAADAPKLAKAVAQAEPPAPAGRAPAGANEKTLAFDDEDKNEVQRERKEAEGRKRGGALGVASESLAKPEAPAAKPAPAKVATKGNIAGIELRSAEMAPKDFDDRGDSAPSRPISKFTKTDQSDQGDQSDKKDSAKRDPSYLRADGNVVGATTTKPSPATAGGGAATAVPGMMPQANHAAAPAPAHEPVTAPASAALRGPADGAKRKAPAKPVSRTGVAQAPAPSLQPAPPPPPPVAAESQRDNRRFADKPAPSAAAAGPADAKPTPATPAAEEKAADDKVADKALIDWAQKQREQVIALVKANNCPAAANTAAAIYNRAPDFYAANIATDRSIKPCIAYVNNERERVDRSRAAAKRVNAADTPAQAAPPARK
jgi:hypothetical protein